MPKSFAGERRHMGMATDAQGRHGKGKEVFNKKSSGTL
jgi:hypothetical protein